MPVKVGWLVNDCLTCIPGTETIWHDLLEWFPALVDKTNGYTDYKVLADKIEQGAKLEGMPDYIIRNATYFRRINLPCKQITLLQDRSKGDVTIRNNQLDVCNNAVTTTVFNSNFTYEQYKNEITEGDIKIIPLGTDFNFFNKRNVKHPDVLPNSILFVGANNVPNKRFNIILDLINTTNYNFCIVMKDNFSMDHPRVKVFNRVSHDVLVKIHNSCEMLICTSIGETQHLASIEAGACKLPLLMTNCGALYNVPSGPWGLKESGGNYLECIAYIKAHKEEFSTREFLLSMGLSKDSCKKEWTNLIEQMI